MNFQELINAVNINPISNDILQQMTVLFKYKIDQSLSLFISEEYQSLFVLEHKIWQILSQDWSNHPRYLDFFQTFALFNKQLIFEQETISLDIKTSLLIPENIDLINNIFEQIEQNTDDNNLLITIASLWFDNLSFFVNEYPSIGHIPVIIHINECIANKFILSENFQFYLRQLQQPQLLPLIFSAKQLFYVKTCTLSLSACFSINSNKHHYISGQVLKNIGHDYLKIIQIQSFTVDLWNKEILACIAHLIGFMRLFLWCGSGKELKFKDLFPTEKILCAYIQDLIRIIDYKPYYNCIMAQWHNDETILIDSILLSLMNIIELQNINWFFRSMTQLPDILLTLAETSKYYRIYLCAYGILGEVLTDEHLKALKITDNIRDFFFTMLEEAWYDPSKEYKNIPVAYFLRGNIHKLNLS
ncbi:unnamed protein product [Adineta steineri]|uniref:Uncharacterized protein n=1 Tax=Adineta steineri TaxID=433720 RepID=A0A814LZT8_9BILA|nr:unnamed protein product [Adineta steineri]CAF1323029.1 unnamed protein product [Adineta steineri]